MPGTSKSVDHPEDENTRRDQECDGGSVRGKKRWAQGDVSLLWHELEYILSIRVSRASYRRGSSFRHTT